MWINKQRIIIAMIIFVFTLYFFSLFMPTTIGNEMIKYIDNEEIVKITCIIDNLKIDDVQYHITDSELISSLHNYFNSINITRTLSIPRFKNENSFLIFIYDKSGKVATISTQTSIDGELYFYLQSNKWYRVNKYNDFHYILTDILDIIENGI
jgi:hypothetical protein